MPFYDANGNLVTGDGLYRVYNSLNQLWKVYNGTDTSHLLVEYTYDSLEERVLMKNVTNLDGTWKETVIYPFKEMVRVKNASGTYDTVYVKHEGQLIAEVSDGVEKFYHPDHLGSSSVITNSSGKVIENTSYTPYV